jgi:hypothetical protein
VTSLAFLLLIAYLVWGQLSRERDRVEREALVQAGLLSAQVERYFGALRCRAPGSCSPWPSGWSLRSVAKSRWRARWTVGHGSPSLCQSRDSEEEALRSLCDGARSGQSDPDLVRVFLELRLATTDQLR